MEQTVNKMETVGFRVPFTIACQKEQFLCFLNAVKATDKGNKNIADMEEIALLYDKESPPAKPSVLVQDPVVPVAAAVPTPTREAPGGPVEVASPASPVPDPPKFTVGTFVEVYVKGEVVSEWLEGRIKDVMTDGPVVKYVCTMDYEPGKKEYLLNDVDESSIRDAPP